MAETLCRRFVHRNYLLSHDGRSCIISTFRLLRGKPAPERARFRVVTTAIHEVGHMLGLLHCPVPRCLMNDARGSIQTVDRSTGRLCSRCRAALARKL